MLGAACNSPGRHAMKHRTLLAAGLRTLTGVVACAWCMHTIPAIATTISTGALTGGEWASFGQPNTHLAALTFNATAAPHPLSDVRRTVGRLVGLPLSQVAAVSGGHSGRLTRVRTCKKAPAAWRCLPQSFLPHPSLAAWPVMRVKRLTLG